MPTLDDQHEPSLYWAHRTNPVAAGRPVEHKAAMNIMNRSPLGSNQSREQGAPVVLSPTSIHAVNGSSTGLHAQPWLNQVLQSLSAGASLEEKVAAAQALKYPLSESSLNRIEVATAASHLVSPQNGTAVRKAGLDLIIACLRPLPATAQEKHALFEIVTGTWHPDDFYMQLAALAELTANGSDTIGFELRLAQVLSEWLTRLFAYCKKARRAKREERENDGASVVDVERNLQQLFNFIDSVVRSSIQVFDEASIIALIKQLMVICNETTTYDDLKNALTLVDTMITYGWIPSASMLQLVQTLCNIHYSVKQRRAEVVVIVEKLCLLQNPHDTVTVLLQTLQASFEGSSSLNHRRRGAVLLLEQLLHSAQLNHAFRPSLSLILSAIKSTDCKDDVRLQVTLLALLITIIRNENMTSDLFYSDWQALLAVIAQVLGLPHDLAGSDHSITPLTSSLSASNMNIQVAMSSSNTETVLDLEAQRGILVKELENVINVADFVAKDEAVKLLLQVGRVSDETATTIIQHFADERLCRFSTGYWQEDCEVVVNNFVKSQRPAKIRLMALQTLQRAYQEATLIVSEESLKALVVVILGESHSEADILVYQAMVDFLVDVADTDDGALFSWVVECLRSKLPPTSTLVMSTPTGHPKPNTLQESNDSHGNSFEGVAARGFAHIFAQSLLLSSVRAIMVYDVLIEIAKAENIKPDARLAAMQILMRLRADANDRVYLATEVDCTAEASYLSRCKSLSGENSVVLGSATNGDVVTEGKGNVSSPSARQSVSSGTRSTNWTDLDPSAARSLWVHPEGLPWQDLATSSVTRSQLRLASSSGEASQASSRQNSNSELETGARISEWLIAIISSVQNTTDWDVRSYLLVHLGAQLSNVSLFKYSKPAIAHLMNTVCHQIRNFAFQEPPRDSGVKKNDVALCVYQIATNLIPHHHVFGRSEQEELVKTIATGIGGAALTSRICIQALAICCFELPNAVSKHLSHVLSKLSMIITQSHIAVHVLEFLALLARRSEIYGNFREQDFKTIFGISFQYLRYVVDQRYTSNAFHELATSEHSMRNSALASIFSQQQRKAEGFETLEDFPQYVYALAYHVITFWFMCLRLEERINYVSWITQNLVYRDPGGEEVIDDQSEVTIDMLHRVAFSDVDELLSEENWASQSDGRIVKRSWIAGYSIITIETAICSGLSKITRREASGTSHFIVHNRPAPLRSHQHGLTLADDRDLEGPAQTLESSTAFFPNHIFMQLMVSSARLVDPEAVPIKLPEDDRTDTLLRNFDRNPTVDSHKIGVIYVGDGQTEEADILANDHGSEDYTLFLERLGVLVRLKDADFYTQGLDKANDTDGEFTVSWRDRVTELMFHVTTLMPTDLENDPRCTHKKKHIGNDYVNIIYNDSGKPVDFDTFPSDFNFVNIIITPETRMGFTQRRMRTHHEISKQMYKIEVKTKSGLPEISPVVDSKMVSMSTVPGLVRLLAINASVFSLVWANREGGEHVSSWRNRLREIKMMRMRYSAEQSGPTGLPSAAGGSDRSVPGFASAASSSISQTISSVFSPVTRRTSAAVFLNDIRGNQEREARTNGFSGSVNQGDGFTSLKSREQRDAKMDDRIEKVVESLDFSRWAR